jgi:hypothetical protein
MVTVTGSLSLSLSHTHTHTTQHNTHHSSISFSILSPVKESRLQLFFWGKCYYDTKNKYVEVEESYFIAASAVIRSEYH